MAPKYSKDDDDAKEHELRAGFTMIVNWLSAALLTSPQNEHYIDLQAKHAEVMRLLHGQQIVIENQQREIEVLQGNVKARNKAFNARFAALEAPKAVAQPIHSPTRPLPSDDNMALSSPVSSPLSEVTPLDPYKTPKASKGKRSPRPSSSN
jgi:hypothetical protein